MNLDRTRRNAHDLHTGCGLKYLDAATSREAIGSFSKSGVRACVMISSFCSLAKIYVGILLYHNGIDL